MISSNYEMIDILVATPSVISKLTSVKLFDMDNVRHAVLDEADTLLDDSFSGYIKNFLGKLAVRYILTFNLLLLMQTFCSDFLTVHKSSR